MNSLAMVAVWSALAVVVFDACAALASLKLRFAYTRAAAGSSVIYAMTGWFAGQHGGMASAALVGATIGFVDATVGWAVSWAIGPGRLPNGTLTPKQWFFAAAAAAGLATVCALVGAAGSGFAASSSAPVP